LMVLEVMVRSGRALSELAKVFERVPQHLINIQVTQKPPLDSLAKSSEVIKKVEAALGDQGRVLVRYSGTENKARVMVEGSDPVKTKTYAEEIAAAIKAEIGA
jgi:phosphoglucosamine mutase